MKSILAVILLTCSFSPTPAWPAPPDMAPVNRAAAVMGDCARMAEQIVPLKAPAGLSRSGAAEFINEQAGGELVPVDPGIDKFIKQISEKADRLGDCGKTYRAALKDSEALIAKLQSAKLSQQDAAAIGAAMDKYGAATEKLEAAMESLSAREDIQPYVSEPLREYFLKDAGAPESAQRGTMSAAGIRLPAAGAGLDPQLARQLKDIYQKKKEQLRLAAEAAKKEAAKAQLEEKDRLAREKAAADAAAEAARLANLQKEKEQGDPLSPGDKRKVLNWIAEGVASARQPYCYRDSYGRGVGVPLSSCPSDKEKDAWLCYPKCKSGYDGVGPVCWQGCPGGYVDTGAFCHINKPLTKKGKWECVKRVFGVCIMKALDCPGGYVNAGLFCALKTPPVPPGYKGLSGLDIIKDSYGRGVGAPMDCAPGQQEDAGLCYTPCKGGFSGVGPVCWMNCPGGKTDCGAGCADSKASCVTNTAQMVISPLVLAMNIASAGGTASMTSYYPQIVNAFKVAKTAGSLALETKETIDLWATEYSRNFAKMTTPGIADRLHAGCSGHAEAEEWLKKQYALQGLNLMLEKDLGETAKDTLSAASSFDPTGVSGVVSAYYQPVCSPSEAFPNVRFLR